MSGGFFRGTSADQDTRFSNKQAKLMKSQKFAAELEHLVDMTKVKMDVMRPWIANRVTELIGFEDEVLINFIYGLLEGKVVNGKEVQISLTGFMERNTRKFMKELWVLLLSAQKNASGVPQQFLDAKEEETKKKKAESDRITNEIQRRKDKESQEIEQEKNKKDADNGVSKDIDAGGEPSSKEQSTNFTSRREKEKQSEERIGSRGRRYSRSPLPAVRSSSARGMWSRSPSKSISNSGSYSNGGCASRSLSASPARRQPHSPPRNCFSRKPSRSPPRRRSSRRSLTPPRHRSSYYRRRSLSQSCSPSPRYRVRSPLRRRSRSPLRRRSRSPLRRRSRSPMHRRSRSPMRQRSRSPLRRRSRSAFLRRSRSPTRRSPSYESPSLVRVLSHRSRRSSVVVHRQSPSPLRYRSPSPLRRRYRRSPLTPLRRSPSPVRLTPNPRRRRSPSPANHKSPSPQSSSSAQSRSLSIVERKSPERHRLPVDSSRERMRKYADYSPVRDVSPEPSFERSVDNPRKFSQHGGGDSREPNDSCGKVKASSPSPRKSLSLSKADEEASPTEARRSSGNPASPSQTKREKISQSFALSPQRESKDSTPSDPSSKVSAAHKEADNTSKDGLSSYRSSANISKIIDNKDSHGKSRFNGGLSPRKISAHPPDQTSGHHKIESNHKDRVLHSGNTMEEEDHLKKPSHRDQRAVKDSLARYASAGDGHGTANKKQSYSDDIKTKDQPGEDLTNSSRKVEQNAKSGSLSTSSEDSDENKAKVREKKKSKRQRDFESEEESSFDSYEEERKETKRRRKEEKKLRKEERRKKRQEKRRKKEEKRAKKKAPKSVDLISSPSDTVRYSNKWSDDDQNIRRRESRGMGMEETESEQKKLEMQLREKALESLRAKKGIGH